MKPSTRSAYGNLRGNSSTMREVFAVLELASRAEATVLLQGQSGTGKELAASAIHDHSDRATKPFVVIDCSALPESVIDSHLFGHVKGAFTGAVSDRKGAFLEASGGTIFLDEIGELPLDSQAKLLRVLETQTVQAVGNDTRTPFNARVITATHRDLHEMVAASSFRLDLYYRLAVVHVLIPPLRSRPEDIPTIVQAFYQDRGVEPGAIEGENLDILCSYAWPGNVRELRNVLDRAWVISGSQETRFEELPIDVGVATRDGGEAPIDLGVPFKRAKELCVDSFEGRYLRVLMAEHKHNISRAAESSGLSRFHLRELLKKNAIEKPTGSR